VGGLGLILSFEPPPFDRAIAVLPVLRDVLPPYYWQLVILPVACLAGAGADALVAQGRALRTLGITVALFTCVALAAVGLGTMGAPNFPKAWAQLLADLPEPRPRVLLYHLVVIAAVAVAAAASRLSRAGAAMSLLVIVTGDVTFLMSPHLREKPSAVLRRPLPAPVVRLAADTAATHTRIAGEVPATSMASFPMLAALPDVRMAAPLVPDRYEAFLVASGFDEAKTQSCCAYYTGSARSPWAELAGVRYVVADAAHRAKVASDPSLSVVETLPLATVYENPAAFGRARLFLGAIAASSREDALAKLEPLARAGEGNHVGDTLLGKFVVLEPAGEVVPSALPGEGGSVDVRWIRDDPDEIVVATESTSAGYLMLADTYYPGWRSTVDGASVPIFPADVGFRAVPVPGGTHTVRFVYRPLSVWAGVALFAAAVVAAWAMIRRERSVTKRQAAA
jgi:hypothetical protein